MGEDMHGIRPENLSDAELVRYARLTGAAQLPPDWVAELIKRLEQKLDDLK
jgi:hypothetical protein